VSAAPIIGGMEFLSFRQPAVLACFVGKCSLFLGALLVQVTALSPQAVGRLLAVCPYMGEVLAVIALRKAILSEFVCLYLRLSSNMMGRRHISAIVLGITRTERWSGGGSAETDQSLGLLGRQI
jgi:hypothetical protein